MAGNLKGITIEIGGDTTKLGKALTEVNSKTKSLQSELKGVNTLLKMDPGNVTLLTQKQELLTQAVNNTKEKLETLKIAQEQAQEQFEKGEITEEQYRDLQREIVLTEQKLEGLTDEVKEFGSVGAQQVALVGEKVQEVGGKVENFGKKFSVISAGTGALLAGSISAFVELDSGYDTIITKTGATGDALEELNAVADNIFGSMPTDMDNVGIAVGEINTRFGYTGDELEDLSTKFIQFAEINGVDLNNSIGTVDKVLEQFNMDASESGNVLDLITLKAQQTGIGADTLMNSIQQNGATFKDMGIGVNEAVVLLSQFEANGIDVGTALKGLKKATVEYAKDGISMEKGLAKTIKTIKNAKTETEALAEVEKLFGAKGANEMVKAIREGRFSVEDLSSSMEDYAGTVENTFNATLDPIDQGKIAMNNLKLAGSELGGVLQSTFAPMLTSLVEKLKQLATWFSNLSPAIQKTIVITLSITTALGPLIIGVGKLITAFGSILTVAPKLVTAFNALKTTLVAHPILAIGTIIATVAIPAFISLSKATDENIKKTWGLTEENKKLNESIEKTAEAQKQANEARAESNQAIDREMGYCSQLWDELQGIVDANGKIKKGYEERATVITGLLADSLGIEISIVDGQIKKYADLKKSIESVIATKRAEALLNANEGAYTEAIQKQADAFSDYTKALNNAENSEKKLAEAEAELARLNELNDEVVKRTGSWTVYSDEISKAKKAVEEATKANNDNKKALETAQGTYLNYSNTISQYEGLMGAIASGDAKQLADAMTNLSNNFVTAENASKSMLTNQLEDFRQKYADMKQAVADGMPGVTQEQVDQMANLVTRAEAELDKIKSEEAGETAVIEYGKGIRSKTFSITEAGKSVAKSADSGLNDVNTKKTGANKGSDYVEGIKGKQTNANSAGKSVANSANSGLGNVDSKKTGSKKGSDYAEGIKGKQTNANTAGKSIANSANSAMGAINTLKTGNAFGNKFVSGISQKNTDSNKAGKNLATKGKTGAESVSLNQTGKDFASGFGKGVNNKLPSILSICSNFASKALNKIKSTLGVASPAKETIYVGEMVDEGFAVGITNAKDKVLSSLDLLLGETKTEVQKVSDEINKTLLASEQKYADESIRLKDKTDQATKDYLETLKTTAENERKIYDARAKDLENLKKTVQGTFKSLAEECFEDIQDLADLQTNFATKLTDRFGVMGEVDEVPTLFNLDAQIKSMAQFNDTLTKIRDRGNVPQEFFAMIRDMSIEDAYQYSHLLLNLSDEEFNEYIEDWKKKQEVANEISKQLYATEAEELKTNIHNKFTDASEDFFGIGQDAGKQFDSGFLAQLQETVNTTISYLSSALMNLNPSVTGGLTASLSFDIPQLASGGIVNRPTIAQIAENGREAIVPLENNTDWINKIAMKIHDFNNPIGMSDGVLGDKLDRIYDRLTRLQIVLDTDTLVGETIDKIDAGLANKQLLNERGV